MNEETLQIIREDIDENADAYAAMGAVGSADDD